MNADMSGRTAVITGGASGIGETICRLLAAHGAMVVVADRDDTKAAALASELSGSSVSVDVTSQESVAEAAERIETDTGPVDTLITSAGVTQPPLPPEELEQATWDAVLNVDLRGTWLSTTAFGHRMAVRGRGSIVTIASIAGMRSMPLHAYTPAKAGVIAMTSDLAAEWGRSGVRVNSVSPGYTLTPLLQDQIDRGHRDTTNLTSESALGKLVQTNEVAQAVHFLCSDNASGITGINLPVDAGWLATAPWHTYGGIRDKR